MRLLALWLALVSCGWAEWVRLTSPNFELLTDAGERTGRRSMVRLEQIRQVFRNVGGERRGSPIPVRVFLFSSERDYRRYQPNTIVKAFYQGGADANYIVMLDVGEETYRIAFHEYVHLVLNHSSARLPQWLEEGIAEFYSTVEPSGDKVIVGRPIPSHVETLRRTAWLDAGAMARIRRGTAELEDPRRAGVFYAQSWALVHMLNLARGYRERMPRYAELIAESVPAEQAFETAFGKPLARVFRDLRDYVAADRWAVVEVEWEPPAAIEITCNRMPSQDVELARAGLELQLGLWEVSEETLKDLARQGESTSETETARGLLAMSRRDFEAAKQHLERAMALGSRKPSTYFEYAMLIKETGGDRTTVADYLRKTVELNPNHAEAHFLLGTMAAAGGNHEAAVESYQRATEVLPRQASFWHALALAYRETGRRELARRAAQRALDAAVTPQEVEMAKAAIELAGEKPVARVPDRPAVTTPPAWFNKTGDSRIEGLLDQIDCLGAAARLHVRADDRRVALLVRNPGEVLLRNATSLTFEFSCGNIEPRAVAVDYTAKPDTETATEGEVTSIEFR